MLNNPPPVPAAEPRPDIRLRTPEATRGPIHRPIGSIVAWLRRRNELERQRRALERLDDRLLRDVGLHRDQAVREAARLPFWPF